MSVLQIIYLVIVPGPVIKLTLSFSQCGFNLIIRYAPAAHLEIVIYTQHGEGTNRLFIYIAC